MNPLKNIEQLPLVVDNQGNVSYVAENGTQWQLFKAERDWSTVSTRRMVDVVKAMAAAYNAQLSAPHNTDECDPDGHIVFDSVCCGARLYRCAATEDGLPSKPIISHGESSCTTCGAPLAQF